MKRLLGFVAALSLLAAISAHNASAASMTSCVPTTMTGGTLVLGDGPLSDTATLGSFCSPKGTLTFEVFGIFGQTLSTYNDTVNGIGDYSQTGPLPTDPGTYKWKVTYTPN